MALCDEAILQVENDLHLLESMEWHTQLIVQLQKY